MSLQEPQINCNMEENHTTNKQEKETVIKQFIAASVCSMVCFMDGTSIAWTSSALPQLETGDSGGWIGGAFCIGALLSSPCFGLIADARGRKTAGFVAASCFLISWVLILSTRNVGVLLTARLFAGAGSSGSITVPYIYNNEVSTPRLRAVLGGMLALMYSSGIFIAFCFGAVFSYEAVAGIYVGVTLLFFPLWWKMPESPALLLLKNNKKEAFNALKWLRGSTAAAQEAVEILEKQQAGAAQAATIASFFKDRAARKAFWICTVMVSVQSFSGILAVHSYAETIFIKAGGPISPLAGTLIYGSLQIFGALVPQFFGDRAPRKVLLGSANFVMAISMAVMATQSMFPSDTTVIPPIALGVSVFAFSVGLGSILFIILAEIFTDENRGVASAMLVAIIWITNFFVLQFFGKAIEAFGDHVVFYFFSAVCLFGAIFCMVFIPETRGRTPQEVVAILLGETEDKHKSEIATLHKPVTAITTSL